MLSPDILYKIIGNRIKECREKSRYTQQDVADYLGLSRASIANYESGRQKISIAELFSLAERFSVGIEDLLPSSEEFKTKDTPENKLDKALDLETKEREELKDFVKKTGLPGGGGDER